MSPFWGICASTLIFLLLMCVTCIDIDDKGEEAIQMFCEKNCRRGIVDPQFPVYLRVKCNNCRKYLPMNWTIHPQLPEFHWEQDARFLDNNLFVELDLSAYTRLGKVAVSANMEENLKNYFEMTLVIPKTAVKISIKCTRNCEVKSDTDEDTSFLVFCQNCTDPYVWKLLPPPSHPDWETKFITYDEYNTTMTILHGAYLKSEVVKVSVSSGMSNTRRKVVFESILPVLSQTCVSNCKNYMAADKTVLKAICEEHCGRSLFIWETVPKIPEAEVSGTYNESFVIPAGVMKGGKVIELSVSKGGRGKISEKITFRGGCVLTPKDGYSGVTEFLLNCSYDSSFVFTVYQRIADEPKVPGVLLHKGPVTNTGAKFWLAEGSPAKVTASVQSLNISYDFEVLVEPYRNDTTLLEPKADTIVKAILSGEGDKSLSGLIEQKEFEKVIQLASLLMEALNSAGDSEFQTHYSRHVLEKVTDVASELEPFELLSLLVKVAADPEFTEASGELIAKCLFEATQLIHKSGVKLEHESLNVTMRSLLMIASSLTKASDPKRDQMTINEDEGKDYPMYKDLVIERIDNVLNLRRQAMYVVRTVEAIGQMTDSSGAPLPLASHDKISTMKRYLKGTEENITMEGADSFLTVSDDLSAELSSTPIGVQCHFAVFKSNPFWWDDTAKDILSDIVMINLSRDKEKITHVDHKLDIFLKTKPAAFMNITGVVGENDTWAVHTIKAHKGSLLHLIFHVPENSSYHALVTDTYPTWGEVKFNGIHMYKERPIRFKKWEMTTSLVYIAIVKTLGDGGNYTVEVKEVSCVSWKGDTWSWTREGCQTVVDPLRSEKDKSFTHCRCDHLSLFGAAVLVPPNHIVSLQNMTIAEILSRSAVVLCLLIAVLVLYAVFMMFAARRDNFLARHQVHRLADTVPGDSHLYLTGVVTGMWRNSGTSANVALQLIGEDANSRVHLLNGRHRLKRANEDWFAVFAPEKLGALQAVRLYHDSAGKEPHWFCDRVTVRDVAAQKEFVFVVRRWFSLIFGDGQTERQTLLADKSKTLAGKVLFPGHAKRDFQENHLWFSILTRPADSTFTCKERVTVAVSVLLLSMVSSAMFFGVSVEDPGSFFSMTLREIVIILESVLITVPVGVLLAVLFRKSAPSE